MANSSVSLTTVVDEVEAFLSCQADPAILGIEEQAQILAALWEMEGCAKLMHQAAGKSHNAALSMSAMRSSVLKIIGLTSGENCGDEVIERAREIVDALPFGYRKQAALLHISGRFVSEREYLAGAV